jgi:DNA-directed RNA polymerase specialized sigma24 family protein
MADPIDIETRFSVEDGMAYMDSIFTEPSEEDLAKIDQIKDVMEQLPPREADFVDLYYFRKLKQTDIARIFGVSQPTVCYRLQRATSRVQFLLQMPKVDKTRLEQAMSFLPDPLDAEIMVLMWETTCQSEVAKRLGVSQGLVRHRFFRTIGWMHGCAETLKFLMSGESGLHPNEVLEHVEDLDARDLKIRRALKRLPELEAQVLDLHFLQGMTVERVALQLKVPQDDVQLLLRRASTHFLARARMPKVTRARLRAAMSGFLEDPKDAEVVVGMWEQIDPQAVAATLRMHPTEVAERFCDAVKTVASYATMFTFISDNLNILREVRRPTWDHRVTHSVD